MSKDIFNAISSPTRRLIISLIAVQAMSQNALAENFNTTRQAIAKHMKILVDSKLVKQKQVGREMIYYFNPQKLQEVDKWLEPFRIMWEEKFKNLDELLENMNND